MKRIKVRFLAVPILAFLALWSGRAYSRQQVTSTVNVNATCNGNSVNVTVAPWRNTVHRGNTVVWVPHAGVTNLQIIPPANWPFPQPPPYAHGSGQVSAGVVPASAPAGTYHYTIRFTCSGLTIAIDPEMIISDN